MGSRIKEFLARCVVLFLLVFMIVSLAFVSRLTKRNTESWPVSSYTYQRMMAATVMVISAYGSGAGVVIDPDGTILTCNHILEFKFNLGQGNYIRIPTTRAIIKTLDGRRLEGKVIWNDPSRDLAKIKVDAELPYVSIRTRPVEIGEPLITIGHPLSLWWSVSHSKVMAPKRRAKGARFYLIQIQMDVNRGNSGGGLFDENGQLVGIVSGGIASNGIAFAIPTEIYCKIQSCK